jgi:hypothetical protein
MEYGAPYCLNLSGSINCRLIALCIMLTCWGYIFMQVIVYYGMDILAVFLIRNGHKYPLDLL